MLKKRKANRDMEREVKKICGKMLILYDDDVIRECAIKVALAHGTTTQVVMGEYRRHGYLMHKAHKLVDKKGLSVVAAARKCNVRACRLSALVAERKAIAIAHAQNKARYEARQARKIAKQQKQVKNTVNISTEVGSV
jgi:plasmid maintenance system antidote protein VapI